MRLKLMRKNSAPLLCRPDGGHRARGARVVWHAERVTPGGPGDDGDRGEKEKEERRERGTFRVPRNHGQ